MPKKRKIKDYFYLFSCSFPLIVITHLTAVMRNTKDSYIFLTQSATFSLFYRTNQLPLISHM